MSHDHPNLSPVEKRALLERLLKEKLRPEPRVPLTAGQRRLWELQSLEDRNPVHNISLAYQLRGPLDVVAFEQALREIVKRHESLRTTIAVECGKPVQVIRPDGLIPLIQSGERSGSQADWIRHVEEQARGDASTPFDLSQGPLARFRLLSRSGDEHAFLITTHHIITDRWSLGILIQELGMLYTALTAEKRPLNTTLAPRYTDFGRWQEDWFAKGNLETQIEFWKASFDGPVRELILPADRQPSSASMSAGLRFQFRVSPEWHEDNVKAFVHWV